MELEKQISELVGDNGKAEKILEIIKRENDRAVTNGIKTYTEKTLPGLVESEITKRQIEEPLKAKEKELDLRLKAVNLSQETGIPFNVLLRQLSGDEEKDISAISEIVQYTESIRQNKAREMLAKSSIKPTDASTTPAITRESLKRMKPGDIAKELKRGGLSHLFRGGRN